ncbi:hypothetical protein CAEBREN_30899, partial [Caenorhabditis brenneri]
PNDKVAKWVESESFNLRTESMSSELASTVLQEEQSDSSHSSDYRTVSISSPVGKEAKDAMPAVEKRALQTERRRWTEINERGGNYDNVELGFPDTNGSQTKNWNEEYEQRLPPHTRDIWKTPRIRTPEHHHGLTTTENVRMIYDYYGFGTCSKIYYIGTYWSSIKSYSSIVAYLIWLRGYLVSIGVQEFAASRSASN